MIKLFHKLDVKKDYKIIQLNITLSNFQHLHHTSYDLFYYQKDIKNQKLTDSIQTLRNKFGIDIVKTGNEFKKNYHKKI